MRVNLLYTRERLQGQGMAKLGLSRYEYKYDYARIQVPSRYRYSTYLDQDYYVRFQYLASDNRLESDLDESTQICGLLYFPRAALARSVRARGWHPAIPQYADQPS